MSGFDENPFGEPNVNDPFSSPPVRPATNVPNRNMDDFNPFAEQPTLGTSQVRGAANPPLYGGMGATPQPAMLQPSSQEVPPPAYARSSQQTAPPSSASGLFTQNTERANDGWKTRTTDPDIGSMGSMGSMGSNTPYYPRRNNWPPLPDRCCFQPCFYQDIEVEIHTDFQKVVKQLYYLWMFHGLVLILNVVGGFAIMLAYEEARIFGLGLLYLILFTPFSFLCWFRPAYKAFKTDSSINFMAFFFVFFFQLVVTVIQAIGIPGSGTCGLITAIMTFKGTAVDTFVGILLLFVAIAFGIAGCGDLLLISKVHRIYRHSGASVSKAQEEFATTFLRNEHVQNAASNVAANAVRAQMANAAAPRY